MAEGSPYRKTEGEVMEGEGSRCAEDGVDGGIGDIAEFGVGLAGKISSREAGGRGISGTILIETGTGKEEVEGVFELKLEDVPRCFTVSVKNFITSHRGHEGVGTHTVPEPLRGCFPLYSFRCRVNVSRKFLNSAWQALNICQT